MFPPRLLGVFLCFLGVFLCFGGVFVFFGCFCLSRAARFFWGELAFYIQPHQNGEFEIPLWFSCRVLEPGNCTSLNGKETGGGVTFFAADVSKKRLSRHEEGGLAGGPPSTARSMMVGQFSGADGCLPVRSRRRRVYG